MGTSGRGVVSIGTPGRSEPGRSEPWAGSFACRIRCVLERALTDLRQNALHVLVLAMMTKPAHDRPDVVFGARLRKELPIERSRLLRRRFLNLCSGIREWQLSVSVAEAAKSQHSSVYWESERSLESTRSELQAWVRERLTLPAPLETLLLAAIDAVFTRHERMWQE